MSLHAHSPRSSWRTAPAADLRWRCWEGEYIVFHPASGDTHYLNPIAGEVLRYLERQPADEPELTRHLSQALELSADEELVEQVEICLAQFRELGLIEPADAHPQAEGPEQADASQGSERT